MLRGAAKLALVLDNDVDESPALLSVSLDRSRAEPLLDAPASPELGLVSLSKSSLLRSNSSSTSASAPYAFMHCADWILLRVRKDSNNNVYNFIEASIFAAQVVRSSNFVVCNERLLCRDRVYARGDWT